MYTVRTWARRPLFDFITPLKGCGGSCFVRVLRRGCWTTSLPLTSSVPGREGPVWTCLSFALFSLRLSPSPVTTCNHLGSPSSLRGSQHPPGSLSGSFCFVFTFYCAFS